MPSSTHSSDLHLPSSSTSSPVPLQSLNHALPIKLDRNNYILWKTQMENVVYANGFEEYIDGTKPCPPQELHTGELNPAFVQWRRFDRMVLSWLYSTLTPDIMGQIVGFQTSHDAWMALHKIFSASSKARILQLRLEFQTAKKGADPMLEYILKIKTISDNLAAIGEPVKESDHILQLLGGLGSEYNSIVASLTAREDDLSLHSVHSILLTHEQRLNHQHTSSVDLPFVAAHIAAAPSTQRPRPHQPRFQSSQPRFQSHHSGNHQQVTFSHTRPHNRPHNRPANRPSSSAPHRPPHLPTRPQCQLCGKFGHTVVKCYHRFDITYQGTNGVSPSQDSSPLQAMLATAPDHQDSWFFDTGATHHLSHSAQTLSHVQPYSGADQVTIGDDVLFHESSFPFQSLPAPSPLPQHTPLTSALINPPLLSTSSPPTVSFPAPTSGPDCTSTSDSLPPLLQVPFAPTPSPTPSSSSSPLNTHPMVTRAKSGIHKKKSFLMQTTSEPHTYSQASKSEPWVQAMQHEYQALLRNHTWSLVPPPSSAHIVGCRWIYKLKYLPDGSVERHKARLVAQGFTQTPGVDYFDTFSPVVKPCTIRLILALAVSFQWPVRQLDVENAFLNGDLQEEVFMAQPQGFVHPQYPHYVCKLHKALYGLKQAPRAWFQKLRVALVDYGFQSSRADTSLFIHHTASDILILLVYVDDILVTGSNPKLVSHFISYLHDKFALRDLGPLSYFLGIQAQQQGSVLHLNQQKYIADLLHRTQMEASKPALTPGSLGRTLSQSDGVPLPDPSEYRRIVGALQYVTLTRPDIAFAVNKACQFMAKPSDVHWLAVKRILRYLKGTISLGLHFQPSTSMELQGYSDADWASCPDDRRSTISKSSAESEYRGLVSLTAELVWIQSLLQELCLPTSPPVLWCDNQSAAHLAANPVFHSRSKHIELDLHFIREKVLRQELQICYVPSTDQLADILTKHLSISQFCSLRSKLTVTSPPMSLRGDDNQTDPNLTSSPTVVTEQPCNKSQTNSPNHLT
ncbi:hypothetical protein PVL29_026062 [Vitis rotundifolia]|uniref:Reverse transcriptase Ty1/copia-type domain-containing protein n=1 Tax=Vitis rotundifolia TaxID=103349 RepID=A0AA38YLJ5_VITRO|nr:hypothetical protein PVL29_026062 [Vitis rotundifolia]